MYELQITEEDLKGFQTVATKRRNDLNAQDSRDRNNLKNEWLTVNLSTLLHELHNSMDKISDKSKKTLKSVIEPYLQGKVLPP